VYRTNLTERAGKAFSAHERVASAGSDIGSAHAFGDVRRILKGAVRLLGPCFFYQDSGHFAGPSLRVLAGAAIALACGCGGGSPDRAATFELSNEVPKDNVGETVESAQPFQAEFADRGATEGGLNAVLLGVDHTVLKDELSETPGKTQVLQELLVSPEIAESDLRSLLSARLEEANRRGGFRYHDRPTVVGIYAYSSKADAASGVGQWVGMLSKTPSSVRPDIRISSSVGNLSPDEERFGLSELQRRDVFKQIVLAEDRGQAEAERRHPTNLDQQYKLDEVLSRAYKDDLAKQFELTPSQLNDIASEAFVENWPLPPL
jgi:hypothetical protein